MLSTVEILRPIRSEWEQFTPLFEQTLRSDNPLLGKALDYVLSKRGKQLRPQLVLLAAKMCHGVTGKTLQMAVALELLHTATLIHDDVVDDSPMRRGNDALQVRWSNKVAILVGDYMLSRVIDLVANLRNTRMLAVVSKIGNTLASGELLQIHASGSMWISEEQYYKVIEQKTAALFAACMEAGAESSGGSMRQTTALRTFGHHLGMCFQLKDDIFDYSDNEDLGKPTMNDIRDSKVTLPLLIAMLRAPQQEAEQIRNIAEALAGKAEGINTMEAEQEIKSFVMRYEGVRYTEKQMQLHREKAISALECFHDSETKKSLIGLLDYAINRVH